jgi:hypothetical protein
MTLFKYRAAANKKAQMEMIGLVVIVILITLGMLFMATFALKKDPQKKVFTRKGLAYSTMSAIMKTSITCEEESGITHPALGNDLLEDCAQNKDNLEFCQYQCGGVDCCQFTQDTIADLIDQTLGDWNKRFEFRSRLIPFEGAEAVEILPLEGAEAVEIPPLGKGCRKRQRDSSGLFPLHTEAGLLESVLDVCD